MIAISFTFHQVSQYKNRISKINELREMEAKQDLDGWTDLKGEIWMIFEKFFQAQKSASAVLSGSSS